MGDTEGPNSSAAKPGFSLDRSRVIFRLLEPRGGNEEVSEQLGQAAGDIWESESSTECCCRTWRLHAVGSSGKRSKGKSAGFSGGGVYRGSVPPAPHPGSRCKPSGSRGAQGKAETQQRWSARAIAVLPAAPLAALRTWCWFVSPRGSREFHCSAHGARHRGAELLPVPACATHGPSRKGCCSCELVINQHTLVAAVFIPGVFFLSKKKEGWFLTCTTQDTKRGACASGLGW